jgi:hypothetical protein
MENMLNTTFTAPLKEKKKKNKVLIGALAKKQGDDFEAYFTNLLKEIEKLDNSPILAFRKHSNEIVRTLAKIGRFDLIAKLGHKKGDLDYSITLKSGYTVFVECKSGDSSLSKEQKELIEKYKEHSIPYFLFTENDRKKEAYIKATNDKQHDILRLVHKFNKILGIKNDNK